MRSLPLLCRRVWRPLCLCPRTSPRRRQRALGQGLWGGGRGRGAAQLRTGGHRVCRLPLGWGALGRVGRLQRHHGLLLGRRASGSGGARGTQPLLAPPRGPLRALPPPWTTACPRNNLRAEGTFLTVERLADGSSEEWEVVHTGALRLLWEVQHPQRALRTGAGAAASAPPRIHRPPCCLLRRARRRRLEHAVCLGAALAVRGGILRQHPTPTSGGRCRSTPRFSDFFFRHTPAFFLSRGL